MLFLYPFRPVILGLTLITSFMIWLLVYDIFSFLVMLYAFPLVITVLVYFKYLFAMLERTANGYTGLPVLTFDLYQPFAEFRPYQLLLVVLFVASLSGWFLTLELEFMANVLIAYFLITTPAFIGLLGIRNGFYQSLNPVMLSRFMLRTGLAYLVMLGLLAAGSLLILNYHQSRPGLFTSVYITLYGVDVIFLWIGKIIYTKREVLDFRPDKSPERAAEQAAEELLFKRKNHLARVFKERRREQILAVLLAHIEEEEDKLAAHAWYHSELKQWDNKRLALKHAPYYISALRDAGKHIIADLIQQECRLIDPEFTIE